MGSRDEECLLGYEFLTVPQMQSPTPQSLHPIGGVTEVTSVPHLPHPCLARVIQCRLRPLWLLLYDLLCLRPLPLSLRLAAEGCSPGQWRPRHVSKLRAGQKHFSEEAPVVTDGSKCLLHVCPLCCCSRELVYPKMSTHFMPRL